MTSPIEVLLVEDDEVDARAFLRAVSQLEVSVTRADSVQRADEQIQQHDFDVLVVDLHLADAMRYESVDHFVSQQVAPVLVYTGRTDRETITEVLDRGAWGFIPKTANNEAIAIRMIEVVSRIRRRGEVDTQRSTESILESMECRTNTVSALLKQVKAKQG